MASGGKAVLKDASRALLPAEVIDRTKGYFPVPGIRHLNGPMMDVGCEALANDAARARALPHGDGDCAAGRAESHPHHARPNALWQLAVLEMWLQNMAG